MKKTTLSLCLMIVVLALSMSQVPLTGATPRRGYDEPTVDALDKPKDATEIVRPIQSTLQQSSNQHERQLYAGNSELNPGTILDFQAIARDAGWVLTSRGLFWTDDSGSSWRDISPPVLHGSLTSGAAFNKIDTGWVVVAKPDASLKHTTFSIAHTSDGGTTWDSEVLSEVAAGVHDYVQRIYLQMLDSQTGWLTIRYQTGSNFNLGTLFRTDDGGRSWKKLPSPTGDPVYFVDQEFGWIAGGAAGRQLFRTTNGGAAWDEVSIARATGLRAKQLRVMTPVFANSLEGLVPVMVSDERGAHLNLYTTQDGGRSWAFDSSHLWNSEPWHEGTSPFVALDRDNWMLPVSNTQGELILVTEDGHTTALSYGEGPRLSEITELRLDTIDRAWAVRLTGNCAKPSASNGATNTDSVGCWQGQELLILDQESGHWRATKAFSTENRSMANVVEKDNENDSSRVSSPTSLTEVMTKPGFDKCEIPSLNNMQSWWTSSPYWAVNLYIGGANRSCANSALSLSYLTALRQQGWKFIPTWVGLQRPCTPAGAFYTFSYDPAVAFVQGTSEADSALAVAASLGLAESNQSGSIIYLDIEGVGSASQACRDATKAFVDGWTSRLRAKGNLAGVYGSSCSSYITDYSNISNVPDAIWPAGGGFYDPTYNPNATVWGISCIADNLWSNHQRIYQYNGTHYESWGGVSLQLDSDVLDGLVVGRLAGGGPGTPDPQQDGPVQISGPLIRGTTAYFTIGVRNNGSAATPAMHPYIEGTNSAGQFWRADGSQPGSAVIQPGQTVSFQVQQDLWTSGTWTASGIYLWNNDSGTYWMALPANGQNQQFSFTVSEPSAVPTAPSNLRQSGATQSSVTLAWDDNSNNESGFKIYRWNGSIFAYLATVGANVTTYTHTSLPCGATYAYQVTAYNDSGESNPTGWINATTNACTPLTVGWVSPSNGQTIDSRTVNLQANPSGGSGGINRVAFSAKWAGSWHGVQEVTSSPWAYTWDWCNAGVPNGDVELGLEVWDNAGGHYVYSEHYANYHITKNFNCSPTPPPSAEFDAWPQTGQAPLTVAMHIVSTANMTSCSWNYGDGHTGTSCSAYHNHIYTSAGLFTVSLTVSGPGGTDTMTRANYINATSPGDPLTVSWLNPANGQTINSRAVSLQANPNGGSGGINRVAFSAKWAGSWHGVQEVTSSPWAYTWDWCNAGVPDGDVELGLEVWDNGGNHYVYSEHYPNYHVSKNYNCNPASTSTPTPTPTSGAGCPTITAWKGEYWNNETLSGSPALCRNDTDINFEWYDGSPSAVIQADHFSARWTRSLNFSSGTYRFEMFHDDGVRLYVDGGLVYENWCDVCSQIDTVDVNLTHGTHTIRMELRENVGFAAARLTWQSLVTPTPTRTRTPTPTPTRTRTPTPTPTVIVPPGSHWRAEFFNNETLSGTPVLVRNDSAIDFDWAYGAPAAVVNTDHFSARWVRAVQFPVSGTYWFHVLRDDGARLRVDNSMVLNEWRWGHEEHTVEIYVSAGTHTLQFEIFEIDGWARAGLSWQAGAQPRSYIPWVLK